MLYSMRMNDKELQKYSKDNQLPWELKLRIVTGIANSRTIISAEIRNIFLDENLTAKLFEFQFAIPNPEGETHIDLLHVIGTYGFLSPAEVAGGALC
ncbi:hypothetical protein TIFTF001_010790 [Ficus carica]|uniref:Uncharacterized protein n=1 Tax=Ficus carica TaxID=3494 RepID=A0AA87ZW21_FICCA|nr:hypothetical protein TIFTF001_010790 [Ficus carica]